MLDVTYSHAAPFIREQLCLAASRAVASHTKRERDANTAAVQAYARSLRILLSSTDYVNVAGIANEPELPDGAVDCVVELLGLQTTARLLNGGAEL